MCSSTSCGTGEVSACDARLPRLGTKAQQCPYSINMPPPGVSLGGRVIRHHRMQGHYVDAGEPLLDVHLDGIDTLTFRAAEAGKILRFAAVRKAQSGSDYRPRRAYALRREEPHGQGPDLSDIS